MRVLIASFFGDPDLANAPAQFSRSLCGCLVEAGHEIEVWTGHQAERVRSKPSFPIVPVPIGPDSKWLARWRPNPVLLDFARRELSRLQPDLVVLSAWNGLGDTAAAAQELDIPYVLFLHDYSLLCLRSWLLDSSGRRCSGPESVEKCTLCTRKSLGPKRVLRHTLCSLPLAGPIIGGYLGHPPDDHIRISKSVADSRQHCQSILQGARVLVAQTPRARDILQQNGIAPEKIVLLSQSIPEEKRSRSVRRPPGQNGALRFGFLGRWSMEKGSDLLLEAFLRAELPTGSELWLIVSNPSAVDLPALEPSSEKRIRVLAGFSGVETSDFLSRVDLCVVPSRCEELASRAALEAMTQGTPVLTSDSVGNSFLVQDGVNGRVFPSGSLADLQRVLEEVGRDPSQLGRWADHMPVLPSIDSWSQRMQGILVAAADRRLSVGRT